MYYLITYGINRNTSNKTRFMHKVTEDPILEMINLSQDKEADYTLINVLEINNSKYLTQSIETIKNHLEFK